MQPSLRSLLAAKGSRGRILLIDDEQIIRRVGHKLLDKLGFHVVSVASGQAGLDILQEDALFDLAIIDMIMPGLDGEQTFQAIHRTYPHIKLMLSSGYTIDSKIQRLLSSGAAGFIQKPFGIRDLWHELEPVVARIAS